MEWERCYISRRFDSAGNPTGSMTLTFIGTVAEGPGAIQAEFEGIVAMLEQRGWERSEVVPIYSGPEAAGKQLTHESIWFRRAPRTEGAP